MEEFPLYNNNVVKISNTGNTLFCKEHKESSVRKEWLIFSKYSLRCGDLAIAILAAKKFS